MLKGLSKIDVPKQLQTLEGKAALIVNPRVYSKISNSEDAMWLLRAIEISSSQVEGLPEDAQLAWTQAMIYLIVGSTLPPESRRLASRSLTKCASEHPDTVPKLIVKGLWTWIQHVNTEVRDSAAVSSQSGTGLLWLVVRTLCAREHAGHAGAQASLADQMVRLVVLCRLPLIDRVQWIDLCLKAKLDPHQLVSDNVENCLQQVQDHTNVSKAL